MRYFAVIRERTSARTVQEHIRGYGHSFQAGPGDKSPSSFGIEVR